MLLGGIGAALILAGCASIIHGGSQKVGITSEPIGAEVTIDNKPHGATPLVAKLARKDNHMGRIEMAGYEPLELTLTRDISGWFWGNIGFGGIIGMAIDAASGSMYKLTPEQVAGTLNQRVGATEREDSLYVTVVLNVDPRWQRIASLTPVGR